MKKTKFAIFFVFLIFGCATVKEYHRLQMFQETSDAYAKAVQWSYFETASSFGKDAGIAYNLPNVDTLKKTIVTSYEVKHTIQTKNSLQIIQIAEISYYKTDKLIEKTLRDHQVWEYDPSIKRWYLKSGLPDFK